MDSRHATPRELVEALQHRADGARARLWEFLRAPVGRLMDELRSRHRLGQDRERLTTHALHAAETWLRTRPATSFTGMTWGAFRAAALLHLAKLAALPFGRAVGAAAGPQPLPESHLYDSETLFLPHDRVGPYWFGGDWFGGLEAADGSLWVIVADVTGHGYFAYLLASALPGVWQACWGEAGPAPAQPADLLAAMHGLLADCLPEGVYAECTLVRLSPGGEAVVAPAGGSRLLLRRGRGRPDLLKLRGTWLGLKAPSPADQRSWVLGQGDELLLGSDGVFDHLEAHGEAGVIEHLGRSAAVATLCDGVRQLLSQALQQGPQRDDITAVLLRRRPGPAVARAAPASPPRHEVGDV
jgi:serine phosphatase RsbU (regulator of sigma subunit)